MKRSLVTVLAILLCVGVLTGAAAAAGFAFTDVPASAWYYSDVKNAYDMNLINGKSETIFAPGDNLTYAEAVKLAACMNQRYQTGAVTLTNGQPWYQTYVDYCVEEGIIDKDYSWNQAATRAGYMEIFANALPGTALAQINEVEDGTIPDVSMRHPQADAIYMLYRAGILQGNDKAHNCNPAANIKRSEVSAILTRMMDATERIAFTMTAEEAEKETEEETVSELKIKEQPESAVGKAGDEVLLEVWIEGGKAPYTYTWLCGDKRSAGIINGYEGTWVAGGSREESGSYFSKLYISLPAEDEVIGDTIFCVIADSNGQEVMTDMVTVTMEESEPLKIKNSPEDVEVLPGETAELSIEVTGGTKPYKYQWQEYVKTGISQAIWTDVGQTSDTLMVKIPPAHTGGTHTYRCIVKDATGLSLTSDTARVIVEAAAPLSVEHTVDVAGDLVNLMVFAEDGTAPYKFTWSGYDSKYGPTTYVKNWSGITIADGTDSSSLTVNTTKCSCTRYLCTVEDASGASFTVEFNFG